MAYKCQTKKCGELGFNLGIVQGKYHACKKKPCKDKGKA